MLRFFCITSGRWLRLNCRRSISSNLIRYNDKKSGSSDCVPENSLQNNPVNSQYVPSMTHILRPYPHTRPNRTSFIALLATLLSAIVVSHVLMLKDYEEKGSTMVRICEDLETSIEKSSSSFNKILHQMKQTGAAASVLWKSLRSLMSSANPEVRTGFELTVAAVLTDIAVASDIRRAALVGAGGGAVIDWLLGTVTTASGENLGTQAEAARALAFFIADPNVREAVFARPSAVPNLLRFIFLAQPHKNRKRRSSFDISDSLKGRRPLLPKNAEIRDIAAAIEVIENGEIHGDEPPGSNEDDKDGKGMKVLEGTTVLGLSRTMRTEYSDVSYSKRVNSMPLNIFFDYVNRSSLAQISLSSAVVIGLWDDLDSELVAVPFAAWAMASEVNRSHIQELDQDGRAVLTSLLAPERSVKWHGSLVARLLLEDQNLPYIYKIKIYIYMKLVLWNYQIFSYTYHNLLSLF